MLHQAHAADQATPAMLGCDVSKATITVHDSRSGRTWKVINKRPDLTALVEAHPDHRIVVEASGGYEVMLIEAALAVGLIVYRLHPNQAHAFAATLCQRAKTDPVDASGLAAFGTLFHARLRPFRLPTAAEHQLRRLARRRDELLVMRTQERNRLKAPDNSPVQQSLTRMIGELDAELERIQNDIDALFRAAPDLDGKRAVLVAIIGIGTVTAQNLIAALTEIGEISGKQIAALAGLAPFARDSGTKAGYRKTGKGRADARRIIFMATLAAIRFNPVIRDFYTRLRQNGKKPMQAIIASARKLLVIANAKVRDSIQQS